MGYSLLFWKNMDFQSGDRVQLSAAGKRAARITDRHGLVLRHALSRTQLWVQWDGLRTPQLVHHTLLEKLDDHPG
jgi:hypothetical protein